jgi:Zn finger protein HypA/HybF involved in hydrogenase expression
METEKKYFECLSCGRESEVASTPPKCSDCGSGSGVISPHSRVQRDVSHEAFRRAANIAKGKVS